MVDTKKGNIGIHPVIIGAMGAIIGAGVAVVASVALKDKNTQKKVKELLHTLTNQVKEYITKVKTIPVTSRQRVDKKIRMGKKPLAIFSKTVKKNDIK